MFWPPLFSMNSQVSHSQTRQKSVFPDCIETPMHARRESAYRRDAQSLKICNRCVTTTTTTTTATVMMMMMMTA